MTGSPEPAPTALGPDAYDRTGYFTRGGSHLLDPGSPFHRYRTRNVLRLTGPVAGLRVVDLGCGWGTLSFALAEAGASRVVGVDFSIEALRLCTVRARSQPTPQLGFIRADAARTGLVGGAWDLVVAADLVEHLDPQTTRAVLREACRLLRPGSGRLVIWAPSPEHFLERLRSRGILRPDPTHVDYKSLDRVVREVGDAGLHVEVARHVESHLPVLRILERMSMRFLPIFRRRVAVVARRR